MPDGQFLDNGVLGFLASILMAAVIALYRELLKVQAKRIEDLEKHSKKVEDTQIAFTETSRDHHEQMILAHKGFTDRLLSFATSDTELRERTAHRLDEISDSTKKAFQAIESKLDESKSIQGQSDKND